MEQITIDHKNNHSTTYNLLKVTDKPMPIAYHASTSLDVVGAIERARLTRTRIRIYLGDVATGKCWNEENDVRGYVGLSKGDVAYFPILVHNTSSLGGGSLMDDNIIKIKESSGGKVLYQATNFQQHVIDIRYCLDQSLIALGYTHEALIDGVVNARFKSERQAQLYKTKML